MVKFTLKIHPKQRLCYIPKALYEIIGKNPEVVPDAYAALIFNRETPSDKIIKSVQIILEDLRLRFEGESEKNG